MNCYEIIDRVRVHGGDLRLRDDGRVTLQHRSRIPDDLVNIARAHAEDLRSILAEWRIDHAEFVVATSALRDGEHAACLSCGGTWELHGKPARSEWKTVDDVDHIELLVAAQYVVASAEAIAEHGP